MKKVESRGSEALEDKDTHVYVEARERGMSDMEKAISLQDQDQGQDKAIWLSMKE